jgi:hypothetical protein
MTRMVLVSGLVTMLLGLGLAGGAAAQMRWVVVNGVLQGPAQLALLDRYSCGLVPNGSYWLDYDTGVWGYAGSPWPAGHIADRCGRPGGGGGRPSLSERGMLYGTQPWGRGR